MAIYQNLWSYIKIVSIFRIRIFPEFEKRIKFAHTHTHSHTHKHTETHTDV